MRSKWRPATIDEVMESKMNELAGTICSAIKREWEHCQKQPSVIVVDSEKRHIYEHSAI